MADVDTKTDCKLLRTWNDNPLVIDHWVASHQILPFFATIYGWDFRWVIIAVYVVETVENFVWCLEGAYTEDFSNTSISDPWHGIVGVLVGYIFTNRFGVFRTESIYTQSIREALITILDVGFMVAPSAIFYRDVRNLDWLYIAFFPIAYVVVSRHQLKRDLGAFVSAYTYVIVTCSVVFGHPYGINSFYAASISSIVFMLLMLSYHKVLREGWKLVQ